MAIATCTGGAVIVVLCAGTAIACWGIGCCIMTGAISAEGRATELVVSDDVDAWDMMSPRPELEVQPAKAMLARRIAAAAEKRIVTRTQKTRTDGKTRPRTPLTGIANGKLPRKTESDFYFN